MCWANCTDPGIIKLYDSFIACLPMYTPLSNYTCRVYSRATNKCLSNIFYRAEGINNFITLLFHHMRRNIVSNIRMFITFICGCTPLDRIFNGFKK